MGLPGLPKYSFVALITLFLAGGAAPALAQGADPKPTLTVTAPIDGVLASPDIRVTAQCEDDRPGCTISVTGNSASLAVGIGAIDTIVRPPDGEVTLRIHATDATGNQVTTVERTIVVISNPQLKPVVSVSGTLFDVDATRLLVWDRDASPRVLRLIDRATNASQIIWTSPDPGTGAINGFLTPTGAIFSHGQSPVGAALREWRDNTLLHLGSIFWETLHVKGPWATFTRMPSPCCAPNEVIVRNLTTGTDSFVFDTHWFGFSDLLPDGRVFYSTEYSSTPRYEIMAFNPGPPASNTQVTDTPHGNVDPVSDGTNVVFSRSPDDGNLNLNGPWSIVMKPIGGPEIVLAEDVFSLAGFSSGQNYRAAGGYVAFTRWDAHKDNLHTWLRSPDGTERQISSMTHGYTTIEALHENGDVIYSEYSLDYAPWLVRYLARPDGTKVDLGTPFGEPIWIADGWSLKTSAHLIAIGSHPARSILAEGATGSFFTTDVAILNPHAREVPVTIRYLREQATEIQETRTLAARSRTTIRLNDIPELANTSVSTIVDVPDGSALAVERLMSWDASAYGGHLGTAVDRPRLRWMFAEGAQGFFNTYFLLANSGPNAANVKLTFLLEQGQPVTRLLSLFPGTRHTIHAGDLPALVNQSFATVIESDQPIVAERAMYFNGPGKLWAGGHGSAGVAEPAIDWFLAEGATGSFFDTFILLANPHPVEVKVWLDYRIGTEDGTGGAFDSLTLAPLSRLTINLEKHPTLAGASVSTKVRSDKLPIIVERAMYWGGPDGWRETHNSFGIADSGLRWGLAEGRTGGERAYQTYILVSNTEIRPADLRVTFLRDDGVSVERTYQLRALDRLTISASDIPELANATFSTIVESTNRMPITAESAIYWNVGGVFWEGGGNTLGTRLP
jgi:hypothetical protein